MPSTAACPKSPSYARFPVRSLSGPALDCRINSRNSAPPQWVRHDPSRGEAMTAAQIFDLHGRVALVTGASSGLGVRFAEVLAENGASVVLVARRADRIADVKARIERSGGRAIAVEADVRDRTAMQSAFAAAETSFGTVDILINNA